MQEAGTFAARKVLLVEEVVGHRSDKKKVQRERGRRHGVWTNKGNYVEGMLTLGRDSDRVECGM
jgi:hypothetical protein